MNKDIKLYPIYIFKDGLLLPTKQITSTKDYNHYTHNLHHYIKKAVYDKNKEWFEERGIKQKLILVEIPLHEQLHYQAIHNLSDEEFKNKYKISRDILIYRK